MLRISLLIAITNTLWTNAHHFPKLRLRDDEAFMPEETAIRRLREGVVIA